MAKTFQKFTKYCQKCGPDLGPQMVLGSEEQKKNLKSPFKPIRLVRDEKLKRYFVLEDSGQMWHWQGPGHNRSENSTRT